MKFKYLATAAAALIASAPAFAEITTVDAPGAEMFLTVWQASGTGAGTVNSSYTLDLGVTMLDMIANKNTNLFINTDVNSTSAWNSFISTVNPAFLNFNVTVANRAGVDTAVDTMLITFAGSTATTTKNNSQLGGALDQIQLYASAVSGLPGQISPVVNGSSVATSGDAYFGTNMSQTWNTFTVQNSKAVGQNAIFGAVTDSGTGLGSTSNVEKYAGTFFFGKLDPASSTYSLQYQVAAVPEASGFGLALAGFGVLGFLGRRRRG